MNSNFIKKLVHDFNLMSEYQRTAYLKILGAHLFNEANDLKRTANTLSQEINIDESQISKVFSGEARLEEALEVLLRVTNKYPVSLRDLWLDMPELNGYVLVSEGRSKLTSRVYSRTNAAGEMTPYYEYRDTAMSRIAPFKPEWIRQLRVVKDGDPNNLDVVLNKGHLMHQFTFFIGEVNFYWEESGKKHCREMNTGDSCYINPFVPHSFTSRNPNCLGLIIAVTYGDGVRRALGHFSLDAQVKKPYLLDVVLNAGTDQKPHSNFNLALRLHVDAELISKEYLAETAGIPLERLLGLMKNDEPNMDEVVKLAYTLQLRKEDLYQLINVNSVEFNIYEESSIKTDPITGFRFAALARSQSQPGLKTFMLWVDSKDVQTFMQSACHQYVYNYGEHSVVIHFSNDDLVKLPPGASCYIQPFNEHLFRLDSDCVGGSVAKVIIVRLMADLDQQVVNEVSQISASGRCRMLGENTRWY